MKQLLKDIWEKTLRNWYLITGVSLLFVAPHIHNDLAETIVHYIGVMFLATFTSNLLIHSFTVIKWRQWEGDSEFVILGKCVVMACIFLGSCFVIGQMFSGEHTATKIDSLNEEIGLQDSIKNAAQINCDTLCPLK